MYVHISIYLFLSLYINNINLNADVLCWYLFLSCRKRNSKSMCRSRLLLMDEEMKLLHSETFGSCCSCCFCWPNTPAFTKEWGQNTRHAINVTPTMGFFTTVPSLLLPSSVCHPQLSAPVLPVTTLSCYYHCFLYWCFTMCIIDCCW